MGDSLTSEAGLIAASPGPDVRGNRGISFPIGCLTNSIASTFVLRYPGAVPFLSLSRPSLTTSLHVGYQLRLEKTVNNIFGYRAPAEPKLGYTESLRHLQALFADDDVVDNVGHTSNIVPEVYYGDKTVNSLRIYAHESDVLGYEVDHPRIEARTRDLVQNYRYVLVGTCTWGQNATSRTTLERVLMRGPFVARHELIPPHSSNLRAAELWRVRSGLFSLPQASALCTHLNSFRRTAAHGAVLDWSVCEGPGPDGDVGQWVSQRAACGAQFHRVADDLAGFGIERALGSRICSFKISHNLRYPGSFSYLPVAPAIEPLYHIECVPVERSLVEGTSISVFVGRRMCQVDSKRREAMLEYADYAGAYPDLPVTATGLQNEHYYFRADREWTGVPTGPYEPRPHEHAGTLFTAAETLSVMKHLRAMGFQSIRRIQDLKACSRFGDVVHDTDAGAILCSEHCLSDLGLTIRLKGLYKPDSTAFRTAKAHHRQFAFN